MTTSELEVLKRCLTAEQRLNEKLREEVLTLRLKLESMKKEIIGKAEKHYSKELKNIQRMRSELK